MLRSTICLVLVSLSLAGLVGCSGGPDEGEGTSAPTASQKKTDSDKSSESDGTNPAPSDDTSSNIGPECTKYFACCEEVAAEQPALAGSCDSTRKSVDDATKKGGSTSALESSCKQALATMKSAGYCK